MKTSRLWTIAGLLLGVTLVVTATVLPSCASRLASPLSGKMVDTDQYRQDVETKARLQEQELKAKELAAQAELAKIAREREQAAQDAAAKQEQVLREAQRVLTRETAKADRARQEAVEALADTFASTVETSGAEAERALRDIQRVYDTRVSELTKDFEQAKQAVAQQQAQWLAEVEAAEAEDARRFAALTTIQSVAGSVATAVAGPGAGSAVEGLGGILIGALGLGGVGLAVKKSREAGQANAQTRIVQEREAELDAALEKVIDSIDDARSVMDPATWEAAKKKIRERQGDTVTAIVQGVRNHRKASDVIAAKPETLKGAV